MSEIKRWLQICRSLVRIGAVVLVVFPHGGMAAEAPVAPMVPSGKWMVSFDDDRCVSARDYGQGRDAKTIGVRPFPTAQEMEIVLVERLRGGIVKRSGTGRVTLNPGSITTELPYTSFAISTTQSATHIYASRTMLDALSGASEIIIDTNHHVRTLSLTATKALITALHRCEVQLLQSWGVDPKVFFGASMPRPAEGNPARWFSADNYPSEALRNNEQGRVVALLNIDAAGRVSDCRVVTSSKSPSLDKTTCQIARRIQYSPARDADGRAVATWSVLPVNWAMP